MKIQKINFQDREFLSLIKFYFLNSGPFPRINDLKSFSAKQIAINEYIETLSELDLSLVLTDDDGGYVFFLFVDDTNDDYIDLEFCFPASNIMEDFKYSRLCFYSLCLHALNYFGKESITGTIRRKNKKDPFKSFLKRYIKALEYKEIKDKPHDLVYLSKESILDHCEKLKTKGDWHKFFDETT